MQNTIIEYNNGTIQAGNDKNVKKVKCNYQGVQCCLNT